MSESIELKPKTASKQSDISSDVESEKLIKSASVEKTGEKPDKSDKSKTEQTVNDKQNIKFYEIRIRKLFIPVTISMIIVLVLLILLPHYSKPQSFNVVSTTGEESGDEDSLSTGMKLKEAIIVAAVFLITAVVITFIMALLIMWKCYRALNCVFTFVFTVSLTTTFVTFFGVVLYTYNIPFDIITTALILWNYVFVGITAIFFCGPKFVCRVYLVFVCALIALTMNKLLPSWTTWAILVMFSLWDIYAVFCGPLKMITKNKKELIENVKLPIYTMIIIFGETDDTTDMSTKSEEKKDSEKAEDDGGGLGLGDFVFYGLLVAKSYTTASVLLAIICLIAILVGLFLTLYCMVLRSRQAMPALPISIFLGLVFYFTGIYLIMPFNDALVTNQIFI